MNTTEPSPPKKKYTTTTKNPSKYKENRENPGVRERFTIYIK